MATLTLTVAASADDAKLDDQSGSYVYDDSAGTMLVGTPGGSPTAANSGYGWRFTGVTLDGTATINNAILKLLKSTSQFNQMDNRWTFEAADNAATFSSGAAPGSRAIVASPVAESNNVNETDGTVYDFPRAGAAQVTLGARLASVTGRAGWASGNAVVLISQSKQDASQQAGFSRKVWHTWDSTTASSEPQLVIDYTAGAATSTLAGSGTVPVPTGSGAGLQYTSASVISGSGSVPVPAGSGAGLTFSSGGFTLGGAGTVPVPAGSGAGLTFVAPVSTISGGGTVPVPAGSGSGLTFSPPGTFTLAGSGTVPVPVGSGVGLSYRSLSTCSGSGAVPVPAGAGAGLQFVGPVSRLSGNGTVPVPAGSGAGLIFSTTPLAVIGNPAGTWDETGRAGALTGGRTGTLVAAGSKGRWD